MIRNILCAALIAVLGIEAVSAESETPEAKVIDCGSEKAVVFEGTQSPDGAYAIGWTLVDQPVVSCV